MYEYMLKIKLKTDSTAYNLIQPSRSLAQIPRTSKYSFLACFCRNTFMWNGCLSLFNLSTTIIPKGSVQRESSKWRKKNKGILGHLFKGKVNAINLPIKQNKEVQKMAWTQFCTSTQFAAVVRGTNLGWKLYSQVVEDSGQYWDIKS